MFSLPQSIVCVILDYALPLIPAIRPEFQTIPITQMSSNPNAFFYVRYHGLPLSCLSPTMLSEQTHDNIVSYLVTHPEYIDSNLFCKNPHPKAVQFILHHIDCYELHWEYLSQNTNDDMVMYLLNHPRMIHWYVFSTNPNDLVVTFLLSRTQYIAWDSFSKNKNKRAISYLLDHPEYITWRHFCKHNDDRVVQYLLQDTELLERLVYDVSCNTHNDIVRYLVDHRLVGQSSFCKNTNPLAIDYILTNSSMSFPFHATHPDLRVFLMMIQHTTDVTLYSNHPHVFYETKNSNEYEWYQDLLLEKSMEGGSLSRQIHKTLYNKM